MFHSHTKLARRASAVLLACALAASPVLFASGGRVNADSSTDSIRDQIQAAKDEQDRLLGEINSLQGKENQSAQNKQLYDQLAGATQNKIYLSQNLLTQLANQITMAESEIADLQAQLDQTMDRYLDRVKDTYEDGSASYLELILGSESIVDFLSRIERINAIMEYDRELMEGYENDMAVLAQKKTDLEQMRASEEQTKADLEADQAYYGQLAAAEEQRLNALLSDEQALQEKYRQLKEAEDQLNAELSDLIARQQQQSQVVYDPSSGFIRPIPQGVGYTSCYFGAPDPIGVPHRGCDIACSTGTPILAAASGVVITSGWHSSYGNYIIIDHGSGISTLYAHCSALFAYAGQSVSQGETIALVGATGFVTGPHVHVEVRVNGSLANPGNYMPF